MNASTNSQLRKTQVYVPNQAGAVVRPLVADSAISGDKLADGVFRQTVADGVDETTDPIPCPGMEVGDEIIGILVFTTKASIATMAAHAGTFTAGVDEITPGTEVDNTDNQYVISWIDKTP